MNPIDPGMLDTVIHRAQRRRRWQQALLLFFGAMTLASLVFGLTLVGSDAVAIPAAMAPFSLTVIAGMVLARMWRAIRAEAAAHARLTQPVADSIDAARVATKARISGYRRSAAAIVLLMLPLFAASLWHLQVQGKMSASDVVSFAVLLTVIVMVLLANLRHRIRHQLEPHLEHLENLHGQF